MRVTITAPNTFSSYGILMPVGSINTVDNNFGESLVRSLRATDTDGVLSVVPNRPFMNAPSLLPGVFTSATLPSAALYPANTQAFTSDAGEVVDSGSGWPPIGGGTLSPSQFGPVDTTGVIACDGVLNLAIQAAITQKQKLILPSGLLMLSAPLIIPKAGGVNQTFQMYGQGGAAYPTDSGVVQYPLHQYDSNTVLYANYTNAPAIIVEAGRYVVLKDFAILGKNLAPYTTAFTAGGPPVSQAPWITAGCQTGRYAPYAGICFDPWTNTIGRTITGISVAAAAVITVSTVSGSNPFTIGQNVCVTGALGMTQINTLYGLVTAIGGASGAWTATTNINSSGFSAWTSGGIAVGLPFSTATISAISKAASAVVTLAVSAGSIQPFQIGQQIYFSGIAGMVEMNGLTGTVTATTIQFGGACTVTVNINSSAFTTYTSAGAATASDAYLSLAAKYQPGADGTYGCVVENVNVMEFCVGIMISPSFLSGNLAADMTFRNVNVQYHDVCYAIGQSQSRNLTIEYGNLAYARSGIDGVNYGLSNGTPPMITRPNFGYLYRIFALNPDIGACLVTDSYAESIICIGQWGGAGASEGMPITFIGCDFNFGGPSWTICPIMLESAGPTKFIGCNLGFSAELEVYNVVSRNTASATLFDHCRFGGSSFARKAPQIGLTLDDQGGYAKFIDCWVNGGIYGGTSFNISTDLGRTYSLTTLAPSGRLSAVRQTQRVFDSNLNDYVYLPLVATPEMAVTATAITLNATTVTFTQNVTGAANQVQVGDILGWTMLGQGFSPNKSNVPALKITNIAGTAVTATMLFDPAQYDTVANQSTGGSQVSLYPNHWAPAVPLSCVTTLNNATLTNVFPIGILQNGDNISGNNISTNTPRVVSGGGTATVVLSLNCLATSAAQTITAITQAASAVITMSTVAGTNPFAVGQQAVFLAVVGMVEINGLTGNVTAIGGSSGAWTITVNINSTAFTAYASGGTATVKANLWFGRLYAPALTAAF